MKDYSGIWPELRSCMTFEAGIVRTMPKFTSRLELIWHSALMQKKFCDLNREFDFIFEKLSQFACTCQEGGF